MKITKEMEDEIVSRAKNYLSKTNVSELEIFYDPQKILGLLLSDEKRAELIRQIIRKGEVKTKSA